MLEKPDIPDALIISRLQEEYGLHATEFNFLPIGADGRTSVYRVVTAEGKPYFLKLRKNFDEVIVRVPLFLKEHGVNAILVPFETNAKRPWADFGEYTMILYPFIQGKNGFEIDLTDEQKRSLGAAFKAIHQAKLPPALQRQIRKENFSLGWRESMREYQAQVEKEVFTDATAAKLAAFTRSKQREITTLVDRAEQLAAKLQSKSLDLVLCHSDIHGGNILIADSGELYIVDWDDPILALKERDLMFIGGGIDNLWKSQREIDLFFQGYENTEIDLEALAYYRYERVIEDLVVICDQLLTTDQGGADRERSYGWFTSNFEPGGTLEIAERTYK